MRLPSLLRSPLWRVCALHVKTRETSDSCVCQQELIIFRMLYYVRSDIQIIRKIKFTTMVIKWMLTQIYIWKINQQLPHNSWFPYWIVNLHKNTYMYQCLKNNKISYYKTILMISKQWDNCLIIHSSQHPITHYRLTYF